MATAVACAGAALVIAGCGSSSNSSNASSNQVVRAAFVSTSASGYQMHLTMRLSSSALPAPISATGNGGFNTRDRTGSFAMDMDFSSIPQVSQVLGTNTMHIEEVLDRTTVYVKLPDALTSRVPSLGGKPWIKIDLAKAAAAAGIPGVGSLVNNPASGDPSQFLQYLRAAGTVTQQGTETINGIQTTKYHGTISLDKVPNAVPRSQRASAQAAVQAIEKVANVHQIPMDVWIDDHNLVRQMTFGFNETVATGQTINVKITLNIVKYGPQPPPTIPPADQVTDASSLASAGAAGGSSGSSGAGGSSGTGINGIG